MTETLNISKGNRVLFTSERTGTSETGTVEYVLPSGTANVHFDDDTYTTVPVRTLKVVK